MSVLDRGRFAGGTSAEGQETEKAQARKDGQVKAKGRGQETSAGARRAGRVRVARVRGEEPASRQLPRPFAGVFQPGRVSTQPKGTKSRRGGSRGPAAAGGTPDRAASVGTVTSEVPPRGARHSDQEVRCSADHVNFRAKRNRTRLALAAGDQNPGVPSSRAPVAG